MGLFRNLLLWLKGSTAKWTPARKFLECGQTIEGLKIEVPSIANGKHEIWNAIHLSHTFEISVESRSSRWRSGNTSRFSPTADSSAFCQLHTKTRPNQVGDVIAPPRPSWVFDRFLVSEYVSQYNTTVQPRTYGVTFGGSVRPQIIQTRKINQFCKCLFSICLIVTPTRNITAGCVVTKWIVLKNVHTGTNFYLWRHSH